MTRVFHKAFDALALLSFVAVVGFVAVPIAQACCEPGCLYDPGCYPPDDGSGGGGAPRYECCAGCSHWDVLSEVRVCCDGSIVQCKVDVTCDDPLAPCLAQQTCTDC